MHLLPWFPNHVAERFLGETAVAAVVAKPLGAPNSNKTDCWQIRHLKVLGKMVKFGMLKCGI